jgi:hypothetical protein
VTGKNFKPTQIIFDDEYDVSKMRRLSQQVTDLGNQLATVSNKASGGSVPLTGSDGQVLTWLASTNAPGWAAPQVPTSFPYGSLTGVPASFPPSTHLIATSTQLGPAHSVSGLTPGMVLKATGVQNAFFQFLNYADLGDVDVSGVADGFVPAWSTATGKWEMVPNGGGFSGLTPGNVYVAQTSTTAAFIPLPFSLVTGVAAPTQIGFGVPQYGLGAPLGPQRDTAGTLQYSQLNLPASDDTVLTGDGYWKAIRDIEVSWAQLTDVPAQLPRLPGAKPTAAFLRGDGAFQTLRPADLGSGTPVFGVEPQHMAPNRPRNGLAFRQLNEPQASDTVLTSVGWRAIQDLDINWTQLSNVPQQIPPYGGSTTLFLRNDGVWATAGGGSASPLTTKGDLYTFSTLNTRLPVGADGTVLSADSTQATGLKWISVGGTGTVTQINAGTGIALSPSPITTTGSVSLAPIPNKTFLGNISGGSAAPVPLTDVQVTANLDLVTASLQGLVPATNALNTDVPHITGAGNQLVKKLVNPVNSGSQGEAVLMSTGKWVAIQDFDIGWEQLSRVPAQLPPVPGLSSIILPLSARNTNRPFLRGDNVWAKLQPADLGNDNAQYGIQTHPMAPNRPLNGRPFRQLNLPQFSDSTLMGNGRWVDLTDVDINWSQISDVPAQLPKVPGISPATLPLTANKSNRPFLRGDNVWAKLLPVDLGDDNAQYGIEPQHMAPNKPQNGKPFRQLNIPRYSDSVITGNGRWIDISDFDVSWAQISGVPALAGAAQTNYFTAAQYINSPAGVTSLTLNPRLGGLGLLINGAQQNFALQINAPFVTNFSLGQLINAGTTSSDQAWSVINAAQTLQMGLIRGDGSGSIFANGANLPTISAAATGQVTMGIPSSAVTALVVNAHSGNVGMVAVSAGTSATDFGIAIQGAANGPAAMLFQPNAGSVQPVIGAAGAAGQWVTGSAVGDLVIRTNAASIRFSIDGGTTSNWRFGSGGGLVSGTNSDASGAVVNCAGYLQFGIAQAAVTGASSAAITTTDTYVTTNPLAIPAGVLFVNNTFRITMWVQVTSSVANVITITPRLGSAGTVADTALSAMTPTAAASGSGNAAVLSFIVVVRATGASGSVIASNSYVNTASAGLAANLTSTSIGAATTINTTGALKLGVSVKTAAATTSITVIHSIIERVE